VKMNEPAFCDATRHNTQQLVYSVRVPECVVYGERVHHEIQYAEEEREREQREAGKDGRQPTERNIERQDADAVPGADGTGRAAERRVDTRIDYGVGLHGMTWDGMESEIGALRACDVRKPVAAEVRERQRISISIRFTSE